MKKKLFTIAIALCMVFTMMPAGVFQVETAWASSTDKPTHVEVAGVEMVDDTANQTFYQNDAQAASTVETTDYNAMYDKKSNTLTLKGFTYNGPEMGVYANGDLKIAVVGENTITSTKYGIWTKGDLTISGTNSTTDKLNVTSSGRNAIFAFEDDTDKFFNYAESINISHVSINALADGGDVGIGAPNTVTIKNSYVVSTGKEHGIQGGYFDPADVEGTGNRGNIIITNSVIKAEATSEGANALEKTVTVDGKTYNHKNAQIVNIPDVHEHCICGGSVSSGGHVHDSNVTWTKWTETTSLPDKAGNYYLTEDVALSNTWYPKDGTVLCLSGHTITANGDFKAIRVEAGRSFTLTDCELGGKKGSVTHASGEKGSGVYTLGDFIMYGGTISGNDSNTSATGGGVDVNGSSQGASSFTMYGGTISGNTAISGGGLYVNTGNSFTMYGGRICGNNVTGNGGGVYMKGTITISGDSRITDNTHSYGNGGKDNVCLAKEDVSITITGTLSSKIGVNEYYLPQAGNVIATGVSSGVEDNFVSDDSNYVVAYENGNLVLKTNPNPPAPEPEHKHYICGETHQSIGDHTSDTQTEFQAWTSTTTLPTEAGNYYLTDNVTLAATWVVPENVNINLCMNGFDIYVDDTTRKTAPYKTAIYINSNRQLTLTDCESKSKIEYRGDSFCNGIWLEPNAKANIYNITITKFDSISQISMGIVNYGTVNMYNGNICDNKKISTEQGYGVNGVRNYDTFNMYGGTITGNDTGVYNAGAMKLGGDVNIKGNNVNMLYAKDLRGVGTMTLENLGENADIGITPYSNPTKGNPVVIVSSGAKAADAAKFSLA